MPDVAEQQRGAGLGAVPSSRPTPRRTLPSCARRSHAGSTSRSWSRRPRPARAVHSSIEHRFGGGMPSGSHRVEGAGASSVVGVDEVGRDARCRRGSRQAPHRVLRADLPRRRTVHRRGRSAVSSSQNGLRRLGAHTRRRRLDRRQHGDRKGVGCDRIPDRIRYIEHAGPREPGHERIAQSRGDVAAGTYVAFLDCDDVWLPSALAHRLRVAAAHPSADVVIGGTWRWHSWTGDDDDVGARPTGCRCRSPARTPRSLPRSCSRRSTASRAAATFPRCAACWSVGRLSSTSAACERVSGPVRGPGAVRQGRTRSSVRGHRPATACPVSATPGVGLRGRDGQRRMEPHVARAPPATRFFAWMQSYVRQVGRAIRRGRDRPAQHRPSAEATDSPADGSSATFVRRHTPPSCSSARSDRRAANDAARARRAPRDRRVERAVLVA